VAVFTLCGGSMKAPKALTLWIVMAALAMAEAPQFEVASIRPAKQDGDHDVDTDNGFFRTHNLTLKRLIATAWEIDTGRIIGGPGWIDSDSYDINARIPAEFAKRTDDKVPLMIQSLLADRFKLVTHREPREVSGYLLVVAKKGAKMERAKPGGDDSYSDANNTHLAAKNFTMEAFARRLSNNRDIGKVVVDRTGLAGGFNFELDWLPERFDSKLQSSADDRTSIFTALQEQLGLKLESAKFSTLVLVVDHAEKPGEN
jgi:uncharacterized protein (TIGR03435 family)